MVGESAYMRTHNSHRSCSVNNGMQSTETKQFLQAHDHVVTYLLRILEDCFVMNPLYCRADYRRDCETISRRYTHEGLSFATKTLPMFFDSVLNYLEHGNSDYPSFRLAKGRPYPAFLRQLVKPIYEDYTSDYAVNCMKCLYQLCVSFKKLKGPYQQGVLIKQLDEFIETDQALDLTWSDDDMVVLCKAKRIIDQVLEGLDPFDPEQSEKFLPRPGPGATNSPTEKHERYRPHMLYTQLSECFSYDEWFTSIPCNYRGSRGYCSLTQDGEHLKMELKTSNLLTSRFKFVHKTYGKPRCICIEQLEMQWLQQALRRAMYDRIEHHPLTRGYVSFTDQSVNGLIAHRTSCADLRDFLKFATIDMSAASDRISRKLVEYLFAGNLSMLKALLCLSTRIIELPKDIPYKRKYIDVKKFAPMGSALCFPVMGLIHFALVKSIISLDSPQHINDIPVWVYGDDIIVRVAHAQKVFEWLPHFGMKLNRGKSFVNSLFRESCGVHAYNGAVITPVRFKSIVHHPLSVGDVISALENESALRNKGFTRTADFICEELYRFKEVRASALPIVGPKSPILGFIREEKIAASYKPYQGLKRRWSSSWQTWLYKTRVIVDKIDDCPPIDESEYYLRKQVERTQPFASRMISGSSKGLSVQWKWLPDSAFYHA